MIKAIPRTTPRKNGFTFCLRMSQLCRSVQYAYRFQHLVTFSVTTCNSKRKYNKISRRGIRFPKYAGLGHFTLLFCRRRVRNVQRLLTHLRSHCPAVLTFSRLGLSSWFRCILSASSIKAQSALHRRVHSENTSNVFRSFYAGGI